MFQILLFSLEPLNFVELKKLSKSERLEIMRLPFLNLHDHHNQELIEVNFTGTVLIDNFDDLVELVLGWGKAQHFEDFEQFTG